MYGSCYKLVTGAVSHMSEGDCADTESLGNQV